MSTDVVRATDLRTLGPAALVSVAGFVVFGLEQHSAGLAVLAIAVALGLVVGGTRGGPLERVAREGVAAGQRLLRG